MLVTHLVLFCWQFLNAAVTFDIDIFCRPSGFWILIMCGYDWLKCYPSLLTIVFLFSFPLFCLSICLTAFFASLVSVINWDHSSAFWLGALPFRWWWRIFIRTWRHCWGLCSVVAVRCRVCVKMFDFIQYPTLLLSLLPTRKSGDMSGRGVR